MIILGVDGFVNVPAHTVSGPALVILQDFDNFERIV